MTGLECLKEELIQRGYTKQQADSKVVIGVLEIFSNSDGKYSDMDKILKEIEDLKDRKTKMEQMYIEYSGKAAAYKAEMNEILETVNKKADQYYSDTIQYIQSFYKAINDCETPEARDALRTAQMYVNSVEVDTKYDNTAFIIGLASILSQGNVAPIDQLSKINNKIPKVRMYPIDKRYSVNGKDYVIDKERIL